jgi:hypothetical protein
MPEVLLTARWSLVNITEACDEENGEHLQQ